MAILGMDGFDHYVTDTSGGTIDDDLSSVENYSMELVGQTNTRLLDTDTRHGSGKYLSMIYSNADLRINVGTSITKTIYVSAAVRFKTGYGNFNLIEFQDDDSSAAQDILVLDASGQFSLERAGIYRVAGPSANSINLNTWYWMEAKLTIGNVTGSAATWGAFELRINGDVWLNETDIDTEYVADQTNPIGAFYIEGGGTTDVDWDDLVWQDDNGDFLGDSRIETFMPSAAGASTQWDASAGSNYQCVDEIPWNDDTDYVSTSVDEETDLYGIGTIADNDTVHAVGVHWRARKTDTGTCGMQSRTYADSGNDTQDGAERQLSTDYVSYTDVYETSDGTTSWTKTLVDDMQVGIRLKSV